MEEINNHDTIEEGESSSHSRFGAREHQRTGDRRGPQYEQTWNTIDRGAEHSENLLDAESV